MKESKVVCILAVLLCSSLSFAGMTQFQPSAEPKKRAAPNVAPDSPVAIVNGVTLTWDEYSRELKTFVDTEKESIPKGHSKVEINERDNGVMGNALVRIIERELLYQESKKFELSNLDDLIKSRDAAFQSKFRSKEEFTSFKATFGLTDESYGKMIAKEAAIAGYIENHLASGVVVTDDQVKEYYEKDGKAAFDVPEKVGVRHILVGYAPEALEETKERAFTRVEELRKRILAGENFADVAAKESDDPLTRYSGGDLGLRSRSELPGDIADLCFSAEIDNVTKPAESRFGIHLFYVYRHDPATKQELADVREIIRARLLNLEIAKLIKQKVSELKRAADVKIVKEHI